MQTIHIPPFIMNKLILLRPRLSIIFIAFISHLSIVFGQTISVPASSNGGFGNPSTGGQDFIECFQFETGGQSITLNSSGVISTGEGTQISSEGIEIFRSSLFGDGIEAYSSLEQGLIQTNQFVSTTNGDSLISNFGALVGAFVPDWRLNVEGFRAFDSQNTQVGIESAWVFLIGGGDYIFNAPVPGTLYVGINGSSVSNWTGDFTVSVSGVSEYEDGFEVALGQAKIEGDEFVFSHNSEIGGQYVIYGSDDLVQFSRSAPVTATDTTMEYRIPVSSNKKFYKVNRLNDFDSDGLSDDLERLLQTDAQNSDTDFDGIKDLEELSSSLSIPPLNDNESGGEISKPSTNPFNPYNTGGSLPSGYYTQVFVRAAEGSHFKQGYRAFESRKTNLPPQGFDYVPYYLIETHSNTGLTEVEGFPAPHCWIPNWEPASFTWTKSPQGQSDSIETIETNNSRYQPWIDTGTKPGGIEPARSSFLRGWGDPDFSQYGATSLTGIHRAQLGQKTCNGVTANPFGRAQLTGSLTTEFTTDQNIQYALKSAIYPPNYVLGEDIRAWIKVPGHFPAGGGSQVSYGRYAEVRKFEYRFQGSDPNLRVASVFIPDPDFNEGNSDPVFSAMGSSGSLPDSESTTIGEYGLFAVGTPIEYRLRPCDGQFWAANEYPIGNSPRASFVFAPISSQNIRTLITNHFTASSSIGSAEVFWNSVEERLHLTVDLCESLKGNSATVQIALNGIAVWGGILTGGCGSCGGTCETQSCPVSGFSPDGEGSSGLDTPKIRQSIPSSGGTTGSVRSGFSMNFSSPQNPGLEAIDPVAPYRTAVNRDADTQEIMSVVSSGRLVEFDKTNDNPNDPNAFFATVRDVDGNGDPGNVIRTTRVETISGGSGPRLQMLSTFSGATEAT